LKTEARRTSALLHRRQRFLLPADRLRDMLFAEPPRADPLAAPLDDPPRLDACFRDPPDDELLREPPEDALREPPPAALRDPAARFDAPLAPDDERAPVDFLAPPLAERVLVDRRLPPLDAPRPPPFLPRPATLSSISSSPTPSASSAPPTSMSSIRSSLPVSPRAML
jgi:hypothetical protein